MRPSNAGICLALAGSYLVLRFAAPCIGFVFPNALAVGLLYVGLLMLAQLALIVGVARLQLRPVISAILILPGLVVVVALALLEGSLVVRETTSPFLLVMISACRDLSLMLTAGMFGYTVSFIVREPNIILPAALFAGLVDFWGVTWGPLSHVLEHRPDIVEKVAVKMPAAVPALPGTMIGMGDFVFLALFFGVLCRFSMNVRGAFWLGYALLTASMFIVLVFESALPALVPMAIAIIIANRHHFKLKREELLATLFAGIILLALLIASGVFLFGSR